MNRLEPMSEAEHWWNHLTFAQREFCTRNLNFNSNSQDIRQINKDLVQFAYVNKEGLRKQAGWPETPMRSI